MENSQEARLREELSLNSLGEVVTGVSIVILIDKLVGNSAGSEKQVIMLCDELARASCVVELVVLRQSEFLESFKPNYPVRCIELDSITSSGSVCKMLSLRKELQARGQCVVHAYFPDSCVIAPLFLYSKTTRVVTSRRDMGLIYNYMPLILFRLLRFRVDAVVSNSKAVSEYCAENEGMDASKLRVVGNAVELPKLGATGNQSSFSIPGAMRIVNVANIKPVKRQLDLLKAIKSLNGEGIVSECVFVGQVQDTDYYQELEYYVLNNGMTAQVHFLGCVSDPYPILFSSDVGVLSSESEGLSNALMEYMSAELYCIASNVGGNPELIHHNKTGKLYEVGDSDSLANCLKYVHKDESRVLGQNARKFVEETFSAKTLLTKHLSIYEEAVH